MEKDFFSDVYEVVLLIPKGRVTSYGAIGKYLGKHNGARMVGWAMNKSHSNPSIPAHRVVNRNGLLSGKFHFEMGFPFHPDCQNPFIRHFPGFLKFPL